MLRVLITRRVLELEPESADALLGLAMIAFGSVNVQEGLNSGLQYLQRAYAAEPAHPGVLIMLSHFAMVKGMYEEVRRGVIGTYCLIVCAHLARRVRTCPTNIQQLWHVCEHMSVFKVHPVACALLALT
jgi:hypothetical protein